MTETNAIGPRPDTQPERPDEAPTPRAVAPPPEAGPAASRLKGWIAAHRVELALFAVSYVTLAAFSSQRFLRQSEAPHFVYQAKAWLEGRVDLDPEVLPNLEDWACVREVGGERARCAGRPLPTDRWYVSFPWFPAVAMLPFVALHGYQFNDTSFGVFVGALAVALFYSLLRLLAKERELERPRGELITLPLLLAFGTLFFYCAIRGEVWFSAEVMGVALTCLYLRFSVKARRPFLAGLVYSMAVLTRTPLLFAGVFFLVEALCPGPAGRLEQLKQLWGERRKAFEKLGWFALGAAPLAVTAAVFNQVRFGRLGEFGHSFLFNNRVNADIDRFGLFHPVYLARNLQAALLKLPSISLEPLRLGYDPHGLTLLLTFPLLVFVFVPKERRNGSWPLLLALPLAAFLLRPNLLAQVPLLPWALLASLLLLVYFAQPTSPPRLHWPLWWTVAVCALPGLFYQNDGYMQFGFRFSVDYTPYLLLLFAIGAWSLRNRWVMAAAALGVVVNFWGAVGFRGYTELMRGW